MSSLAKLLVELLARSWLSSVAELLAKPLNKIFEKLSGQDLGRALRPSPLVSSGRSFFAELSDEFFGELLNAPSRQVLESSLGTSRLSGRAPD